MGQDHSRDQSIKREPIEPPVTWSPKELDAMIIIRKRTDGSSVKELYILEWRVAFFRQNGVVELVADCDATTGKHITISQDNSVILYNAWIAHNESKRLLILTYPLINGYLDTVKH